MYAGYVALAWSWLLQERTARQKLRDGGQESPEFYCAKLAISDFYFQRLLPRAKGHASAMLKPIGSIMDLPGEHFAFE